MVRAIEGIPELASTWRGSALIGGSRLPVTLELRANAERSMLAGALIVTIADGTQRRSELRVSAGAPGELVLEYPENRLRLAGRIDGRQIFFVAAEVSAREVWTVLHDELEMQVFNDLEASVPVWSATLERQAEPPVKPANAPAPPPSRR
jgi:hypothetical protein